MMNFQIFDIVLFCWITIFGINGYLYGLWNGIFSLIKWIIIVLLFIYGLPIIEKFWQKFFTDELSIFLLSALSIFMISIILASWLSGHAEDIIHTNYLVKIINKFLGLFLGILKGIIGMMIIITIIMQMNIKTHWIEQSKYGNQIYQFTKSITDIEKINNLFNTIKEYLPHI